MSNQRQRNADFHPEIPDNCQRRYLFQVRQPNGLPTTFTITSDILNLRAQIRQQVGELMPASLMPRRNCASKIA